jgi:hypothetical protein
LGVTKTVSVGVYTGGTGVSVTTTAGVCVAGVTRTEKMAVKVRSGVAKLSVGGAGTTGPHAVEAISKMSRVATIFCLFFITHLRKNMRAEYITIITCHGL